MMLPVEVQFKIPYEWSKQLEARLTQLRAACQKAAKKSKDQDEANKSILAVSPPNLGRALFAQGMETLLAMDDESLLEVLRRNQLPRGRPSDESRLGQ